MHVSIEPSSYQFVLSIRRDSVDGELSLTVDDDVCEIVDENDGNGNFSMPTLTGRMMADFCSSVETGTMSRSVRIGKKRRKRRSSSCSCK